MSYFKIGNLVLFHGKSAVIQSMTTDKIAIAIENGDSKNVRPKDIEFLHPGPVKSFPLPETTDHPDCTEISELMGDELMSFKDFTELCFSENSPSAARAAYDLLKDDLYFSGSVAGGVKANPSGYVAKKLQDAKEKAEAKERYNARVERIRNNALLPEDFSALGEIEEVALGHNDSSKLLRSLGIEAIPERAHRLLLDLKVWTYANNPFPERFGVDMNDPSPLLLPAGVSPVAAGDLSRHSPFGATPEAPVPLAPHSSPSSPSSSVPLAPTKKRVDLTHLKAYAIDDEGSNDPDDALSFENGVFYVHIADPTDVIEFGSEVDLEARHRAVSCYLPEKTSYLFPDWITENYALGLHETSPAMTFVLTFNDDGEPELKEILFSTVKVSRLTYTAKDEPLDFPEFDDMLSLMHRFRDFRAKNQAVFIQLPEVKISVRDNLQVCFTPISINRVREMVANAMIATGYAVAKWASDNDLALPFVSQEKMKGNLDPLQSPPDTLSQMFALRAASKPGKMGMEPAPHSGLGLSCYVRATSPLRRYVDFLAHLQIRRFLLHQELIDYRTMDSIVFALEQPMTAAKYLERYCREYWTLVWMTQQPVDKVLKAIPVKQMFGEWIFILPEIAYQYRAKIHGNIVPNVPIFMKIRAANPVSLQARMSIVTGIQEQDSDLSIDDESLSDTIDKNRLSDD